VLLTPTVLLALGVFTLSFNALAFVQGAYNAALFGAVGMLIGICMEGRGSGTAALVLALAIALLSPFPTFG
jgi:Na+/H+-translocating membrane pyrophosphatase